ncbi:MAG: acetate--CoA ligase family protein [Candidatus Micrarchaeia archaeon]
MLLGYRESKRLLAEAGIELVEARECGSLAALRTAYAHLAKPLVLKGLGSAHKTEKNMIHLGITSLVELGVAYAKLKNCAGCAPSSFLLQEQKRGVEFIIGGHRDPVFGPVIIFGTGGVLTELYGDVAMRVAPLSRRDAMELIRETRASAFFKPGGFREKKANERVIVDLLLKSSRFLVEENGVSEFDFNPVIADEEKAFIVDARLLT